MTLKNLWDTAISIDIIPILDGILFVGEVALIVVVGAGIAGWLLGRYKGG